MSFFPRLSYLSLYGGELHRKGGVLLKARLTEWERELQYLRFRIAEWKEFGSVEHPDYYPFRSFLLQKVRNHLFFELKTLSSILVACEVAVDSDDVPPLQNYADRIYAFRERISPGEITRRIHLEEWHRYMRAKDEVEDTPSQMDDMFARIRLEISGMERRSAEFKGMVDELVRMVDEMSDLARIHFGGYATANGFVMDRRIPRAGRRSRLIRSPSDLTPMPLLANTRTRLPPPLPGTSPPVSPRLPMSRSAAVTLSASISASNRFRQPPAPTHAPPSPQAPRYAHIHRRLFHRALFASRTSNPPRPRTPDPASGSGDENTPPGTPVQPGDPSVHGSLQASAIAETRTRLPPPLEAPPIPYRAPAPGQRFLSFLQRN